MTGPKPTTAPEADTGAPETTTEPAAGETVTLTLAQIGELITAKVAEAVAALPRAEVTQATPAVAFQNITFDKGTGQPRVVMTMGDPDTDGRVETRTVQERHAHILEALGWTRQS